MLPSYRMVRGKNSKHVGEVQNEETGWFRLGRQIVGSFYTLASNSHVIDISSHDAKLF